MAKRVAADTDEQIIRHSANVPEEVSIDALLRLLGSDISRRTLQRRLSELADAKRLTRRGGGRSTRYLLPPTAQAGSNEEDYVRLSPSGADVRQLVRRPRTERKSVGYNREFLDRSRPNESSYLTTETIAYLTRIGATPDAERPAGTYARHILNRLLVDLSFPPAALGVPRLARDLSAT